MVGDRMEFYISSSVRGESGYLSVIGRCGEESIPRGAQFVAIFRERPRAYPEGLEQPRQVEECRDVRLTVAEIEAYERPLESLPPNSTGILRCKTDVELVPGGWILSDRCVTSECN
jgi:hypothetical protein